MSPSLQALWHWSTHDSGQFVGPLSCGLVFFDVAYMFAMLNKLKL